MPANSADFSPWLGVFETLRVVQGTPLFVAEHFAELRRALETLGIASDFDPEKARTQLPRVSGRWRWLVTPAEARTLFTPEEPRAPEPIEIAVSPVRVGSGNWDARFKTVSYLAHAQAWMTAKTPDVVLLNEQGHVASASRGNIFWRRAGKLFTPAHEAGCRRGVVRGFVLAREKVEPGHFSLDDLLGAEEIFLTNSMRGIVSVCRVEGRLLPSSEAATRLQATYEDEVARLISLPPASG
jgi:branched-chain amino acid aminotransferase/4-amino-4-deoxychorismate lyase